MKYFFILLLTVTFTSCQTNKLLNLKANKFSMREKTNDTWSTFTDWDSVNVDIQINRKKFLFKKATITIFDKEEMSFKVIGKVKETTTDGGSEALLFNCIDKDGSKCHIIFIDQGKSINFVIYYTNINLCYNVVESD